MMFYLLGDSFIHPQTHDQNLLQPADTITIRFSNFTNSATDGAMSDTLTGHGGQAVFDGVSRDRDAEPPVSKHLVLMSGFVLPSELLPLHAARSAHEPLIMRH